MKFYHHLMNIKSQSICTKIKTLLQYVTTYCLELNIWSWRLHYLVCKKQYSSLIDHIWNKICIHMWLISSIMISDSHLLIDEQQIPPPFTLTFNTYGRPVTTWSEIVYLFIFLEINNHINLCIKNTIETRLQR